MISSPTLSPEHLVFTLGLHLTYTSSHTLSAAVHKYDDVCLGDFGFEQGGFEWAGLTTLPLKANAAQDQKRQAVKRWGGIGGIAALPKRGGGSRPIRVWAPCTTPNRAPTNDTVFMNSST